MWCVPQFPWLAGTLRKNGLMVFWIRPVRICPKCSFKRRMAYLHILTYRNSSGFSQSFKAPCSFWSQGAISEKPEQRDSPEKIPSNKGERERVTGRKENGSLEGEHLGMFTQLAFCLRIDLGIVVLPAILLLTNTNDIVERCLLHWMIWALLCLLEEVKSLCRL